MGGGGGGGGEREIINLQATVHNIIIYIVCTKMNIQVEYTNQQLLTTNIAIS